MSTLAARGVVVRSPKAPPVVEELELDPPGPGEVRVRIVATGVCHSDLHAQRGDFGKEFPYLLGHEACGVVEALGEGVRGLAAGQSVVLTWRAPCGACRFCVAGDPASCARPTVAGPRMRTRDGQPLGRVLGLGTFATHTIVAAAQCVPVAAELSPAAMCLVGCAVATGVGAVLNTARVEPGSSVVVFGCGAVGACVILGARLVNASRIVAVDVAPRKLEWARTLGATDVVDARAGDPTKRVRELCGGTGARYAFEAVGLPETLAGALGSLDLGGTCVLIGVPVPGAKLELPLGRFFYGRQTLTTTFGGDCVPVRDFQRFSDWYRAGALDLDALVTRTITLEDVPEAFAAMERGEVLRSVIRLG